MFWACAVNTTNAFATTAPHVRSAAAVTGCPLVNCDDFWFCWLTHHQRSGLHLRRVSRFSAQRTRSAAAQRGGGAVASEFANRTQRHRSAPHCANKNGSGWFVFPQPNLFLFFAQLDEKVGQLGRSAEEAVKTVDRNAQRLVNAVNHRRDALVLACTSRKVAREAECERLRTRLRECAEGLAAAAAKREAIQPLSDLPFLMNCEVVRDLHSARLQSVKECDAALSALPPVNILTSIQFADAPLLTAIAAWGRWS